MYDHIHYSIINGDPIDKQMGTLTQSKSKDHGKIVLLGRAADGRHYTLKGPMTKKEYLNLYLKKSKFDVK